MLSSIQALDEMVLLWILASLRAPALDGFFRVFTTAGNAGMIWICASAVMLCVPRWRRTGLLSLFAMAACYCLNDLFLKPLIMRPRPPDTMHGLIPLVPLLPSSSFASGHTAAAFAAASAYCRNLTGAAAAIPLLLAALMGFSRLYVGVHYPSDVLAGAVIGLCVGALVCRAAKGWGQDGEVPPAAKGYF